MFLYKSLLTCGKIDPTLYNNLYGLGYNAYGQLGDSTVVNKSSPILIGTSSWSAISSGHNHTIGIKSDGTLWSWGYNAYGQLGDSTVVNKSSPVQIGTSSWSQVRAGGDHCLAIRSDGKLYGWGYNGNGQVGYAIPETGIESWDQVKNGNGWTLGIKKNGTLWAAGYNSYGELGQSNTIHRSSPVQIGTSSWSQISVSYDYALAIRSDGALFTWGYNGAGCLGDGTIVNKSSPVQIGTSSWSQVAAGVTHSAAIRSDGTLWTWGLGTSGQLGEGFGLPTTSWIQVVANTNGKTVLAIKDDGTLWAWGYNGYGQLGQSNTIHTSSPVQIGTSTWKSIAINYHSVLGVKTDGSLWAWGRNDTGQLGDSTIVSKSSPVQIGTSSWNMVSCGPWQTYGIRSDASLWAWGQNTYGQLGDSTIVSKSSPVQVGIGLSWITGGSSQVICGTANEGGTITLTIPSGYYVYSVDFASYGTPNGTCGSFTYGTCHDVNSQLYVENLCLNKTGTINVYAGGGGLLGDPCGGVYKRLYIQVTAKEAGFAVDKPSWTQISSGWQSVSGITTDNKLWSWGYNGSGNSGDGTTNSASSPVQIGTDTWSDVKQNWESAWGLTSTLGTKTDGSLWAWGYGGGNRLNNSGAGQTNDANSTNNKSAPVQIGTTVRTNGSYSVAFDGSGDYLTVTGNLSTSNNFTLEAWVYASTPSTGFNLISIGNEASGRISLGVSSSNALFYNVYGSGVQSLGGTFKFNEWNHIAFVRTANTSMTAYLNGNATGTITIGSGTLGNSSNAYIWGSSTGASSVVGYVSNLRFVDGTALYTANFYPTPQPLTPIAKTSLLTCQSSTTIDKSTNAFSITKNGDAYVSEKEPFNYSTIYDSNAPGYSSTYFDGSGDYLSVGANTAFDLLSSDFTVEFWVRVVNPAATSGGSAVSVGNGSGYWQILVRDNAINVNNSPNGSNFYQWQSSVSLTTGWHHVAWTKSSGTQRLFFDGTLLTPTGTAPTSTANNNLFIGANYSGGTTGLNGYISNLRIVKGTAVYTSAFTPPTTPLTAIANTSLLTCQNVSSIKDNSTNAFAITTSGHARPTTTEPFGYLADPSRIGSAYFDGTGDYLTAPHSTSIEFGDGDFTIECWVYLNATADLYDTIVASWLSGNSTNDSWYLGFGSGNKIVTGICKTSIATITTSSGSISNNAWSHIAFVRSGTSLFTFINGVKDSVVGTVSGSINNGTHPVSIGGLSNGFHVNGYISNLRIVKGTALYTKNFEVPKTALYPIGDTVLLTCQGSRLGTSVVDRSSYARTITQNGDAKSSTLSPFKTIAKIANGYQFSTAISADGSIWGWGYFGYNIGYSQYTGDPLFYWQKLYNGGVYEDIQIQQGDEYTWNYYGNAYLKKVDRTLVPMGQSDYGQLGINLVLSGNATQWDLNATIPAYGPTITSRSSPVQVPGSWSQVRCGTLQTLALKTDGTLWSWGSNTYGQLGDGTYNSKSSPVQVGTSSWSQIDTAYYSTMGIKSDGTLWSWGNNNNSSPNNYKFLGGDIYTGQAYSWSFCDSGYDQNSFGIRSDGTLWGWGYNLSGQLGDYTALSRSSPVQVGTNLGTNSWTSVAGGPSHTVAIQSDGSLWAWGGRNLAAGIADPIVGYGYAIKQQSWTNIAVGLYHVVAIKADGTLWGWGRNNYGQVGIINDSKNVSSPTQIGTANTWSKIYTNSYFEGSTFAIQSDGSLWAWGRNTNGVLAINSGDSSVVQTTPRRIDNSSWSQLSLGNYQVLALKSDGTMWTWGFNQYGNLGDGTTIHRSSPVQIGTSSWSQVSAGYNISSAIRVDGALFTWGNDDGTCPLGRSYSLSGPTYSWSQVSCSRYHSLAIKSDGTLWSWGQNNYGQLGDGTVVYKSSPVQIGTSSWSQVFAGEQHSLAIRTDGRLFTWGYNGSGQLGDGTSTASYSPVSIGTSSWSMISAGEVTSVGLTKDGTLWAWGYSRNGMIGNNTTDTNNTTPQQIAGSWTKVSCNRSHMVAIKSDGTLWAWGYNGYGQLGQGDLVHRSSPVQIGASSWSEVSAGWFSSFAIKSDGTLWSVGENGSGQLGQGDTVHRSSPVQVGSSNTWSKINATWYGAKALKTNGEMWGWGNSDYGENFIDLTSYTPYKNQLNYSWSQLGSGSGITSASIRNDGIMFIAGYNNEGQVGSGITGVNYYVPHSFPYNNYTTSSSPVQVGTSSWTSVSAGVGWYGMMAVKSDGTLWSWGNNTYGSVGDGTTVHRSSPVQIASAGVWSKVYPSSVVTAIKSDGTLWGWGYNDSNGYYGIADGNVTATYVHRSSPVQILSGNNWSAASLGSISAYLNTNGELFGRGPNNYYMYGNTTAGYWNSSSIYPGKMAPMASIHSQLQRSSPVQISSGSWSQISVGDLHTLALKTDGTLWAWGDNSAGQLGLADTADRSSPVQIGTSSWTNIGAGDKFSAAIRSDGKLFTWGDNQYFKLGFTNYSGDAYSWSQLTLGAAIRSDGKLFVWGPNTNGSIGDSTIVNKSSPVQIGSSSWTMVSRNHYGVNTYAIRADGTLWGWGQNTYGQLGQNDNIHRSSPVQISSANNWSSISNGNGNIAALKSDGSLWVAGYNGYSQFGYVPVKFRSEFDSRSWSQISLGQNNCIALSTDGTLWSWGYNGYGALGNGTWSNFDTPTKISTESFTQVSIGRLNALAIDTNGLLYAWGRNDTGQLGYNGNSKNLVTPTSYSNGSWIQVATGGVWNSYGSSFAIRSDNTLWTTGYNSNGELGVGDATTRYSWTQVPGSWNVISTSGAHTLGIKSDGTLWAWGYNGYGQLGNGTTSSVNSPIQIGTDNTWTKINAGENHSLAIKSNGTLWTWGLNDNGQLGQNTTISVSAPSQVPGSWTQISGNYYSAAAIRSDGTMWSWGYNQHNQLGDGTVTHRSSPVQIGSGKTWSKVSLATYHSSAIDSTGTLHIWGYQQYRSCAWGNSGENDYWYSSVVSKAGYLPFGNISSPTQVGTSSWSQISSGDGVFFGITSDKKLFTSGYNNYGQLGLGDVTSRAILTQVGNSSWNVVSATTNYNATLAIRSDGTLWAWGYNQYGILGQGNTFSRSSPVQIGLQTNWSTVYGGYYGAIALKTDNTLWAWGRFVGGFLGADNNSWNTSSPVMIGSVFGVGVIPAGENPQKWSKIAAGYNYISGIRSDGKLFNWGSNDTSWYADNMPLTTSNYKNQTLIGFNTYEKPVSSPTQIGTNSWISLGVASNHVVAIRSDGTLWGWGYNAYGNLGINQDSYTYRSSPTQIGTANNWTKVWAGANRTLVLDNVGKLWGTGYSLYNTLMDDINYIGFSRSFVMVSANTINNNWNTSTLSLSKRSYHNSIIKTDGKLLSIGQGNYGQLGLGDAQYRSFPVQVGNTYFQGTINSPVQIGSNSWSQMSLGYYNAVAIKTDGTLWSWGSGQGGQASPFTDAIYRSSPTQVGTANNWIKIHGSNTNQTAINNSNTAFVWGYNQWGENGSITTTNGTTLPFVFGNYTYANYSSPVQLNSGSWTSIDAGSNESAGIKSDGTLWTWGYNNVYQLGHGDVAVKSSPTQVGTSSWTQVRIRQNNSAGITSNGSLVIWGTNQVYGQGGMSETATTAYSWTQLSHGSSHIAAIRSDGKLFVWGDAQYGQLGNLTINRTIMSPVQVGTSSWTKVASGLYSVVAVRSDGTLWTWGYNQYGQLGQNDTISRSSPVQIGTESGWTQIYSGGTYSVVGIRNGMLYTWGDNAVGQLGDYTTAHKSSPVQIGTSSWSQVSVGTGTSTFMLGITTTGGLFSWGYNASGQLGVIDNTGTKSSWSQIVCGASHMMAIRSDGTLWGWGYNSSYAIAQSINNGFKNSPVQIMTGSWNQVAAGTNFSAAIRSDGTLWSWGYNNFGQLGVGYTSQATFSSPVQVGLNTNWSKISAGDNHMLGLLSDGSLWSWGYNASGQLGVGHVSNKLWPVQIGTSSWTSICAGWASSAAIRTDGALFIWGYNAYGQVGDATIMHRSSPVQVGTSSWTSVGSGAGMTLAVRSDGTMWSWGRNDLGQLGLGDAVHRSSPVQIGASANWAEVNAFSSVSMGRNTSNQLFAWGWNGYYGVGDGTTVHRSSPVQIGSDKTWTKLSKGAAYGDGLCASITSDSTAYVWGYNNYGELGIGGASAAEYASTPTVLGNNNYIEPKSSPVQIGTSSWTSVCGGYNMTAAIRSDGALFAWGNNQYGQLGQSDTVHRSSPVQIGTNSWTSVAAGYYRTHAIQTNGTLWAWGYANLSYGNSTNVTSSSPVQIGTSSWTNIYSNATGTEALAGIKSDGTLWVWGADTNGGQGSGCFAQFSSPIQIGNNYVMKNSVIPYTLDSQSWISIGLDYESFHKAAIRSDYTLWTWGLNDRGQLGQGDLNNRSSPTQVGSNSWSQISCGYRNTYAVNKKYNTLYGWGSNTYGELDNNVTTSFIIPTRIGGKKANTVSALYYTTMIIN